MIADVQMSVMSGVELLTHMRSHGRITPFIFMPRLETAVVPP